MRTLYSKRFVALLIAVAMFSTMIYTTSYSPMELAGSISIIFGIYAGLETYRKSDSELLKG